MRLALQGRCPRTATRPRIPTAGGSGGPACLRAGSCWRPPFLTAPHPTGSELNNNLGFGTAGDLGLGPLHERFFLLWSHVLGGAVLLLARTPVGGGGDGGRRWPRPVGSKKPAPSSGLCRGCGPSLAGRRGNRTKGATPAQGSGPPLDRSRLPGRLPTSASCSAEGRWACAAALGEGDGAWGLTLSCPSAARGRRPAGVTRADFTLLPGGAGLWPTEQGMEIRRGALTPRVCARGRLSSARKQSQ